MPFKIPFNLSLETFFWRVLLVISGIIFFPPITDSTGVTVEGFKLIEGTNDVALKWLIYKMLTISNKK